MTLYRILAVCCALTIANAQRAESRGAMTGNAVKHQMTLDPFTFEHVLEKTEAVRRTKRRPAITVLEFRTVGSHLAYNCKCVNHVSYQLWRSLLFPDLLRDFPASASSIILGDQAIVRFRGESGMIQSKTLGGKGLSPLRTMSCSSSILAVTVRPNSVNSPETSSFFVQSRSASENCAREITEALVAKIGDADIWVFLRSDHWFISDPDFPIVYPFEPLTDPPTEIEYQTSFQAFCTASKGVIKCAR